MAFKPSRSFDTDRPTSNQTRGMTPEPSMAVSLPGGSISRLPSLAATDAHAQSNELPPRSKSSLALPNLRKRVAAAAAERRKPKPARLGRTMSSLVMLGDGDPFEDPAPSAQSRVTTTTASGKSRGRTTERAVEELLGSARNDRHRTLRGAPSGTASNASSRAAPSIAASNRSEARTDVVFVGEVDRDDRDLLEQGEKRARRAVYDALRGSAPEFAKGRGRIVPLDVTATTTRSVPPAVKALDLSHSTLQTICTLLSVEPRSATCLTGNLRRTIPAGGRNGGTAGRFKLQRRVVDDEGDGAAELRRRRQEELERQEAEHRRLASLHNFGDEANAFLNAIKTAQKAPESGPAAGGAAAAAGAAGAPQMPVFKPGASRLWGVSQSQSQTSFIVIRERDSTYVIDKSQVDDDEDGGALRPSRGVDFVTPSDSYLNAVQLELHEAVPDAAKLVYLVEREARVYLYELAVRRIAQNPFNPNTGQMIDLAKVGDNPANIVSAIVGSGATVQNVIQYAQGLPAAPTYDCRNIKLSGNQLQSVNIIDLARTVNFASLSLRNALHASFVDIKHTSVSLGASYTPQRVGSFLPLQFITSLDLSDCGIEHIFFPRTKAAGGPGTGHLASHLGNVNVASHPAVVLAQCKNRVTEGAPLSALDPFVVDGTVCGGPSRKVRELTKAVGTAGGRSGAPQPGGRTMSQSDAKQLLLVDIPDVPSDLLSHVQKQRSRSKSEPADPASASPRAETSDSESEMAPSQHASMRRKSTFFRGGNHDEPFRGRVGHWSLAPCAPLRFLVTLYLHGNQIKDFREVLTFAAMSKSTLTTLTWHGNSEIDAMNGVAAAAARALLPKLSSLNHTRFAKRQGES